MQYAGAHRPLLYIRENELNEIKGSKFPVGGQQYKGRNTFETNTILIDSRTSLYIFSDGLPDQFGGDKNRKFGTKRIKSIITKFKGLKMKETGALIENSCEAWMNESNEKQYDDILMMGFRIG